MIQADYIENHMPQWQNYTQIYNFIMTIKFPCPWKFYNCKDFSSKAMEYPKGDAKRLPCALKMNSEGF